VKTEIVMGGRTYSHHGRWLQFAAYPRDHAGWFRLLGFGLRLEDHRIDRPLFSERYNGQHGIPKRRYLHIGPLCVLFLRP
jgi:hypothetical protein